MALSIGILIGVLAKKRKKGISRLKQFKQKIQNYKQREYSLYQFPSKLIFSIIFTIGLVVFFEWFGLECLRQLQQRGVNGVVLREQEKGVLREIGDSIQRNPRIIATIDNKLYNNQQQQKKLRNIIFLLNAFSSCIILILILSLKFKILKINKQQRTAIITNYSHCCLKKSQEKYTVEGKDRVQIWMLGEDRFTNNNYYYSIVITNSDGYCQMIERSSIFESRRAAIVIGELLGIDYSIKIINKGVQKSC